MAHALDITDGTTTVSLSTTNFLLLHYVPNVPAYRNGVYDPVTDSIELLTDTASGAAATTAINSVEKLIDKAIRRQEMSRGPKVYLRFTLDGGTQYRSEIISGSIVLGNHAIRAWGQGKIECTLVVTRVPYWEGSLAQLVTAQQLTCADGSNTYYTATAVTGVLPTPAHVELTNDSGGTQATKSVWLGVNSDNTPATWDGALGSKAPSWTAPVSIDTMESYWDLSNSELSYMKGDYFRFVAVAGTDGGSDGMTNYVYYRLANRYQGVELLSVGDAVYCDQNVRNFNLFDLGTMAVPAGGYSTAMSAVRVELSIGSETVDGTDTINFLQLFPADNVRHYTLNYSVATSAIIVDDPIEDAIHVKAGSVTYPNVKPAGNPLMLYPGRAHRFLWLAVDSGGYDSTFTHELDVYYRPRVLTI